MPVTGESLPEKETTSNTLRLVLHETMKTLQRRNELLPSSCRGKEFLASASSSSSTPCTLQAPSSPAEPSQCSLQEQTCNTGRSTARKLFYAKATPPHSSAAALVWACELSIKQWRDSSTFLLSASSSSESEFSQILGARPAERRAWKARRG